MRTARCLALFLAATATTSLQAQDMIGVTWSGAIYTVQSSSGESSLATPGLFGQNCLARDSQGELWTISRGLLGSPTYFLTHLDPSSLDLQIIAVCNDVRSMADAGSGELFAIERQAGGDALSRINTTTGARTFLGNTGETIVGMTMHQGLLYAYSAASGVGTLDPLTGAFTDAGPFGANSSVQWLAERPDGQLIGGGHAFYTIDVQSGATTNYSQGNPNAFLAGVQPSGMALPFGTGCYGVELGVQGSLKAGSLLTTRSIGYPSTGAVVGMAGALIVGTSNQSFQNIQLPIDLDPLLGTTGCSLYVSPDVSELNFTTGGPAPSLFFPVPLPPAIALQTFYLQHAAFDFTGATYWSNAIELHVGS
ncbi:MAG: hypothetical protein ACI89X_002202 [Planctomycetota bacterium]|jgi:hypothetical protein